MEYYTAIKNEIRLPGVTKMTPEYVIQSEVSQRKKQILYINTRGWNVKKGIPQRCNVDSKEKVWMILLSGQEFGKQRERISGHRGRRSLWGKLKQY